jgi:hypothetical protein
VSELADLHALTTEAMVVVEKDRLRDELRKLRRSFENAIRKLLRARHNDKPKAAEKSEFEENWSWERPS